MHTYTHRSDAHTHATHTHTQVSAICVGPLATCLDQLISLSPRHRCKISAMITHKPNPTLALRHFEDTAHLKAAFFCQGQLDKGDKGLTCALESANNLGIQLEASDFNHIGAQTLSEEWLGGFELSKDAPAIARQANQELRNQGGGNKVPLGQMYAALESKMKEWNTEMDENTNLWMEHIPENVHTQAFWSARRFAVILIPACDGHWVALEHINFKKEDTFCLWEGRGAWLLDHVSCPGVIRRESV